MSKYNDFGAVDGSLGIGGGRPGVTGPLIGGGVTQVATLATRMALSGKPAAKWSALIGTLVGAGLSAALMASSRYRTVGTSALTTALVVGLPRQLEDMLRDAGILKDADLGVITSEQMSGYLGDEMGQSDVQLLDAGLGVHVAEQLSGPPEGVEMMGGAGGFGANFGALG